MKVAGFEVHPAADLFPMLPAAELAALARDIKERGLLHPVILFDGKVLDGRNRLAACEIARVHPRLKKWKANGVSPTQWVISSNLKRRHLNKSQQVAVAVRALALFKVEAKERQRAAAHRTNGKLKRQHETGSAKVRGASAKASEQAAALFGTSARYVELGISIAKRAPDLLDQVQSGQMTLSQASVALRQRERRRLLRRASRTASRSENFELRCGDAEKCALDFEEGSIDLIVADPPYADIAAYEKLGRVAERLLKPGGSLLAMAGQTHLPEVIGALRHGSVRYWWTLCYSTAMLPTQAWGRRVNSGWKPILWLAKGKYTGEWLGDVVKTPYAERGLHKWEQSVAGFGELLRRLAKPGDVVLDPFCASGTTGVAALPLGCRFIGFDSDAKSIEVARQRLLVSAATMEAA